MYRPEPQDGFSGQEREANEFMFLKIGRSRFTQAQQELQARILLNLVMGHRVSAEALAQELDSLTASLGAPRIRT